MPQATELVRNTLSNNGHESATHFERPAEQALVLAIEPQAKREARSVFSYLSIVR